MPLTVNTNIASLNTQRQLNIANSAIAQSLERLSSGLRINRAADDAAGLAIATKLQAQVRGLQQAARNANNAISLVQTAEGALNSVTDILQRLRELAVQAASDDNTDVDRTALNNEATQLRDELTRLAGTVEFNGTSLLDGTFTGKKFQIGANANQTLTFEIDDTRATCCKPRTCACNLVAKPRTASYLHTIQGGITMPLTVNTNIASLNTQRQLNIANSAIAQSLERLSSGLRINRAADDAAGLAIATKLQAQVRGLQQAARNGMAERFFIKGAEVSLEDPVYCEAAAAVLCAAGVPLQAIPFYERALAQCPGDPDLVRKISEAYQSVFTPVPSA